MSCGAEISGLVLSHHISYVSPMVMSRNVSTGMTTNLLQTLYNTNLHAACNSTPYT